MDYVNGVSSQKEAHPMQWAAFIAAGDVSPIATKWSYWWGIVPVILLLLFYVSRVSQSEQDYTAN